MFHDHHNSSQINTKRKRFWVVILLILVGIGFGFLTYTSKGQSSQITIDQLSDRAKEFLDQQKAQASSSWKNASFEMSDERRTHLSPKTFSTDCFTLHFPFLSKNEHVSNEAESCRVELRNNTPPARVVISAQTQSDPLDENANIILRKKFSDKYQFRKAQFSQWEDAQLYDQADGMVLFLKNGNELITIGITEMMDPTEFTIEMLQQVVSGIKLQK